MVQKNNFSNIENLILQRIFYSDYQIKVGNKSVYLFSPNLNFFQKCYVYLSFREYINYDLVKTDKMKTLDCNICNNKNIPMNDTIKIDGIVHCNNCFEAHFPDQNNLEGKFVEREMDPTICSSCHKDFDNIELKKMSSFPICDECEVNIKNRTFPTWVKGFFVCILIIVLGSFFWNFKYFQAYLDIKKSNNFFEKEDYSNARILMSNASERLPEVEDLKTIASYYHGIELLSKDSSSEALMEFDKCKDKLPLDFNLHTLIVQARIGSSFDNKDYNAFLDATKENLELDTTLAISQASVASAYSCIYADNGNDTAKQNAFLYLKKAKAIDDTSQAMQEYYNMVEYRIETRKIIRREDFIKQFPNGWTKN